jgi:hypothetical protein
VKARRLLVLLSALVLAAGLSACGHKEAHPTQADANNDGDYIDAGPITYQMEISRELNQYGTEDSSYVKGLPAGTTPPTATQLWYGVFMWAKNQTHHDYTTLSRFEITDSQGDTYYPEKLDPNVNEFAWTPQTLAPNQIEPGPDTVASQGPTQGGLLLFKLNTTVYNDRPLTLWLLGSGGKKLGSISLNL